MKISMGTVGFAVPIVAGLVLALIGHPGGPASAARGGLHVGCGAVGLQVLS